METKNFESSKKEILRRAKEADACSGQYSRAYKSENTADLIEVIKDNIYFACNNMGISPEILASLFNEDDLLKSYIYLKGEHAIELKEGKHHIILLDSSSANVETWGSSSANVKTWDSSSKLTKEVNSERSFIRSHNDNTIYVLTGSDLRLEEN